MKIFRFVFYSNKLVFLYEIFFGKIYIENLIYSIFDFLKYKIYKVLGTGVVGFRV